MKKRLLLLILLIIGAFSLVACDLLDNPIISEPSSSVTETIPGVIPTPTPTPVPSPVPTPVPSPVPEIDEFGFFNQKDDVALYLYTYGHLPYNYITKSEATPHIKNHWTPENLKSVGGDIFQNRERLLPILAGRIYYEADINYMGQSGRNAERIVYSSDGLIFYTSNHYESFVKYYPETKTWGSYSL